MDAASLNEGWVTAFTLLACSLVDSWTSFWLAPLSHVRYSRPVMEPFMSKALLVVILMITAALSSLRAEMLDKTSTFTPSVSLSESHTDSVATVRDPLDSSIITYEQRTARSTNSTIVANITGIGLTDINATTPFSLDFGGATVGFTLGDIPTYVPGQTTAFYCWKGWSAAKQALGTTGVRLTWTSTRLTVALTMGTEDNRPSPVASDAAVGAGPGAYKDEIWLTLSFANQTMTSPRKIYVSGSVTAKDARYGPVEAPSIFTLSTASITGSTDNTAPAITLLTPKQGASVGAAVMLTGRITDAVGVELIEWAIDPLVGPWTPSETLGVVTQPVGAVWGSTTMAWTAAISGIPPGTHKYYLRGKDPSGNVSAPFIVTLLNPVPTITLGRWDAVLTQTNATDLRGALTITTASNGTWTGKLTVEGVSYNLSGALDRGGSLLFAIKRTGKPDLVVKGTVASFTPATIDVARINGTLEESNVVLASWSAQRSPWSTSTPLLSGFVGRFNGRVLPVTGMTGIGFLSLVSLANGSATISGNLADGSSLSWSGVVNATHSLPVFISLYGGKGSLSGMLIIDDVTRAVPSALLRWVRPANYSDKQFASGWNETVTVDGVLYSPPASGTRVMGLTTLAPRIELSWSGEGVTGTATQRFTVSTSNAAAQILPNAAAASVSITASTGICSGGFRVLPSTSVLGSWRGAIIGSRVEGYYIAPAVSPAVQKRYGRIDVAPAP